MGFSIIPFEPVSWVYIGGDIDVVGEPPGVASFDRYFKGIPIEELKEIGEGHVGGSASKVIKEDFSMEILVIVPVGAVGEGEAVEGEGGGVLVHHLAGLACACGTVKQGDFEVHKARRGFEGSNFVVELGVLG